MVILSLEFLQNIFDTAQQVRLAGKILSKVIYIAYNVATHIYSPSDSWFALFI